MVHNHAGDIGPKAVQTYLLKQGKRGNYSYRRAIPAAYRAVFNSLWGEGRLETAAAVKVSLKTNVAAQAKIAASEYNRKFESIFGAA